MKRLKLIGVLAFACLSIFVFLLSLGIAADPHGGNIFCKDVFPGSCTQGGCDAEPGWWGVSCMIHCAEGRDLNCRF